MFNQDLKLQSIKTEEQNKKRAMSNNVYKITLMLLALFLVFIVLAAFIGIISAGIRVASEQGIGFFEAVFGSQLVIGTITNPNGIYAVGFIVFNTIWMSFLALLIAVPVSVATALLITRIFPKRTSMLMFAVVSILAAIPSVIYGAFAYYVLDPQITKIIGTPGSLLTVIVMIALMITPTITIMTITSINMVDNKVETSSYALGASRTQTSLYITLRSAKTGIFLGVLFALGRAMGEATAISMVYKPDYGGLTIAPWKQSLFLAPLIMGTIAGTYGDDAIEFSLYIYLSAVLLITVLFVFGIMKSIEHYTDENVVAKKQAHESRSIYKVNKKANEEGLNNLTAKEQSLWIKGANINELSKRRYDYFASPRVENSLILKQTSLRTSLKWAKYKKNKTILHYSTISIFSLFGIFMLFGIIFYIFNGGFVVSTSDGNVNLLSWDVITTKGTYGVYEDGGVIYGLAIPLLGTMINVLFCLIISLPLGVMLGLYFGVYLRKDGVIGKFVSFVFQIMTSIPTVVYGTLALVVFSQTTVNDNAKMIEPMIMLCLIILPTIMKQTQEGVEKIDNSLIEGSTALGSTNFITTRKICFKEISPAIISAAILSISIVIAESAIFITIIGTPDTVGDIDSWMTNGGLTLTTTIYKLNGQSSAMAKAQIRSIGLILMILVLVLALSSQLIKNKKFKETIVVLTSLFLVIASITITSNGIFALFIIALLITPIALLSFSGFEIYNKRKEQR
ncbi:MAG: ABC transporter permease subunit [Mycoplasmataceae bacterium]|nr:ABC transporter permease subunit [Mycoplasmataceae bacterium]